MNWNSIKSVIAKGAPVLGGLLGGPVGGAAGTLIASALGVEPTPEAVKEKLANDPQSLITLQQIENEHSEEILRLKNQETQLILADKQQARVQHRDSKVPAILTGSIILGLFLFGLALFSTDIPVGNKDMVNMLIGAVIGYASAASAFWFGADEQQRRSKK